MGPPGWKVSSIAAGEEWRTTPNSPRKNEAMLTEVSPKEAA